MLTDIKSFVVNLIVAICVIGAIDLGYHWFLVPKPVPQITVIGPSSASTPAAMQFSASVQNKPFWLRQTKYRFTVYQDGQPIQYQPLNDSKILLVAVDPGQYNVVVDAEALYNPFWIYPYLNDLPEVNYPVIVSGPTPPPSPNPTPSPTTEKWALAIFDPTQTMTTAQAAIFNSTTIEASLNPINWHVYYTTDVVPTSSGTGPISSTIWGTAATNIGLPSLVTIDSTGSVLNVVPLPATEAAIVQLEQSLGRK